MFGIIAAGKPLVAVAVAVTDVATLGIRQGFAICSDPTNPDELTASVRRLAADPAALEAMGQAALKAATQYSQANELNTMVSLVNNMARRP
jgi:hypothetical protein